MFQVPLLFLDISVAVVVSDYALTGPYTLRMSCILTERKAPDVRIVPVEFVKTEGYNFVLYTFVYHVVVKDEIELSKSVTFYYTWHSRYFTWPSHKFI
jgi:hypothetical protein